MRHRSSKELRVRASHLDPQGEVQHVTGVVNGSTLLVVLWRTHAGEPRGRGCDSCVDFGALRSREVDAGFEERPSTFAQPDICLLHNLHIGTELHACDGRSDCVNWRRPCSSKHTTYRSSPSCACLGTTQVTLTPTSPVTSFRFALAKKVHHLGCMLSPLRPSRFPIRCVCYSDYLATGITASSRTSSRPSASRSEVQPGWSAD